MAIRMQCLYHKSLSLSPISMINRDGDDDEKKKEKKKSDEQNTGPGDYDLPDDVGTKIGESHPLKKEDIR